MIQDIVNAAKELAQGGIVLILIALCGILMWALAGLFRIYNSTNTRVIEAFERNATTIEANTKMGEESIKQSEANKNAIDGFRVVVESLTRAMLGKRDV
jgi:hypothetical protein